MGGWDRWRVLIYIRVQLGGAGGEYNLIVFFSCAFVFSCLPFSVSLLKWIMAVVSVSLFFLYFSCLWSLYLGVTSVEKLLCKTDLKVSCLIIIPWITLEKGECFDFNHSLGCV